MLNCTKIYKSTLTGLSANYAVSADPLNANVYEVREGNGALWVVTLDFVKQSCSCQSRSGVPCDQYLRAGACRHVAAAMAHVANSLGLPCLPMQSAPAKPLPQPSAGPKATFPVMYGVGRYGAARRPTAF